MRDTVMIVIGIVGLILTLVLIDWLNFAAEMATSP